MTAEDVRAQVELAAGVELGWERPARPDPPLVTVANRGGALVGGHLGIVLYGFWAWFEANRRYLAELPHRLQQDHVTVSLEREIDRTNAWFYRTGHF